MLIEKFSLFELLKDGFSILKKQTKNYEVLLYFVVIPSLVSYLFIFFDITFDNDIISNIISFISIFSGILFSVTFVLKENYIRRKEIYNTKNEEDTNYINRYKAFMQQVSTLILFSVGISVFLICFLLSILCFKEEYLQSLISIYTKKTLEIITIFLSYFYLLSILNIIKEVYAMLYDDFEN